MNIATVDASNYGRTSGKAVSTIPNYGGDCALQPSDGLASSVKRLDDATQQLNSATWQLREMFGMAVQETGIAECTSCGIKSEIDNSVRAARAALENVNLVLEHLRS